MTSRVQDWDANSHRNVSFADKAKEIQISQQQRRFSQIENGELSQRAVYADGRGFGMHGTKIQS